MNDESYLENQTPEQLRQKAGEDIYVDVAWLSEAARLFGKTLRLKTEGRYSLHPFSFNRQAAAQRLGLTSRARIESSTLVVFLCCCEFDDIDEARGGSWDDGKWVNHEREFRRKMSEWAEAVGVRLNSEAAKEVERIAGEIWARLDACNGEPQLKVVTGPIDPNA